MIGFVLSSVHFNFNIARETKPKYDVTVNNSIVSTDWNQRFFCSENRKCVSCSDYNDYLVVR